MNHAIKVSNLNKSYGNHAVLKGIDLCVQQGEIFALLGVNGAGKTTLLECVEGLRKYDSGNITVNAKWVYNCSPPLCLSILNLLKL